MQQPDASGKHSAPLSAVYRRRLLGTLTANRVRMVDSGATFTMHSEPTALQQRCFDLLEVSAQV